MKIFNCLDPAVSLQGHHLLEASAGTGKTFAIEHITTRLLLQGRELKQILVVTFTRAATRELKMRIRKAIKKAHIALESKKNNTLPYIEAIRQEGEESAAIGLFRLEQAYVQIEQAQIFTLHGFCARMLRNYGFATPSGTDLEEKEELGYREIFQTHIADFLRTSLDPDSFSLAQLDILFQKYHKERKRLSVKILSLFSQKEGFPSYPNFASSYRQFIATLANCPRISKSDLERVAPFFKKLCHRNGLVKEHFLTQVALFHPLITKESFDQLIGEKELFLSLIEKNNQKKNLRKELPKETSDFFLLQKQLLPILEKARNPLYTLIRIAKGCQEYIENHPSGEKSRSPDDLLKEMEKSLQFTLFLQCIRDQYRAAIIDEFQDTDPTQWNIFRTLFIDKPIETLYLVGDPKQSIFSFRNADIHTYLHAADHMQNKAHLCTNYRSEPRLLAILNALFTQNSDWLSLPGLSLPFTKVAIPESAKDSSFPDHKSPLHFLFVFEEKEKKENLSQREFSYLYPYLTKEIQWLVEKASCSFSQIALLVKDRYQADRLKQHLQQAAIPVQSRGYTPITETLAYSFWKTLLRAIAKPTDSSLLKAFLAHPLFPVSHHEIEKETLFSSIKNLLYYLHDLFQYSHFPAMLSAIKEAKWTENSYLESLILFQGGMEALSDFYLISNLLLEKAFKEKSSLPDLIRYLDDLFFQDSEKKELKQQLLTDSNAVSIMTTHSSKGLEFDIVFALGVSREENLQDEFFFYQNQFVPFEEKETLCQEAIQKREAEKLRKLYVALTRAKKRLYLPIFSDPDSVPVADKKSSAVTLFLSKLPPIRKTAVEIGATFTTLKEDLSNTALPSSVSLQAPLPYLPSFIEKKMISFSSLKKSFPIEKKPLEISVGSSLPKGVQTGIALHAIFELLIKKRLLSPYNRKESKKNIFSFLENHFLAPWKELILDWTESASHIPLLDFCLQDVPSNSFYTEVEFLFPYKNDYIKGFIDLIFYYNKNYYLLDWKSNALEDYSKKSLQKTMEKESYFLQSKLYSEALSRYLKQKSAFATVKEQPKIKGMFYLFLRGLTKGEGVLFLPYTK